MTDMDQVWIDAVTATRDAALRQLKLVEKERDQLLARIKELESGRN